MSCKYNKTIGKNMLLAEPCKTVFTDENIPLNIY